MAYIKSFNESILLKIEKDYIREFSWQIKYKINGDRIKKRTDGTYRNYLY